MQVSLRWLKDYVDIEIGPEALAEKLTMAGLEVESLVRKEPAFSGVVVSKILAIKPHPRADHLSLCEVTDGEKIHSLVCGAPDIRVGDLAPLAKTGAILPGGLRIKPSKIRGELSEGMLCSEEELGIGSDHAGVMILSRLAEGSDPARGGLQPHLGDGKSPAIGEELGSALDLRDLIFTIAITPNRADCLSVIGIAREIGALTGKKLRTPLPNVPEDEEDINNLTSVTISDPDLCPRYSARIIKKVNIMPSPLWMRLRLEGAGLRAINNVVDATNFVMLEMGQPLHAFDYNFLEEGRIVVRRAREGEIFTTLDGKQRSLKCDILLICDGKKPVAVGGIMGGINSEVKETTDMVLLESAYFNPLSIRISAKWLGMGTDASFRFERGVDPEGILRAQNRASQLIAGISGGVSCRGLIDQYPCKIETPKDIPLRITRVGLIAGAEIKRQDICPILENLEMDVRPGADDDTCLVTPPTFRVDIEREIDLIEEIVRIHGFDSIPSTMPSVLLAPVKKGTGAFLADEIRGILNGSGYSEIISYSFVSPTWVDRLGLPENDERRNTVAIRNPLAEDQSVMRTTLLGGLLEAMKRNIRMDIGDLKIFEMGKVFFFQEKSDLPLEKNHMCSLLTGMQEDQQWQSNRKADFYDLKGCAESIFAGLKIGGVKFQPDLREPFLHPGKSCSITINGTYAGFLGELHGNILEAMDLTNRVFVWELDLDVLIGSYTDAVSYREISRFPSITRDVAFLVGKDIKAEEMIELARDSHEVLLEKVSIFDVYEGQAVSESMRSVGMRFLYRSFEKTLTDDEITQVHSRIVKRILDMSGARVRGE